MRFCWRVNSRASNKNVSPRMPKSTENERLAVESENHSNMIPTIVNVPVGSQRVSDMNSTLRTATCPNHTPRKVLAAAINPMGLSSISTLDSTGLDSNLTELVNHVDNNSDVIHRRMLQDAMTQVEDVTGATFRTLQNITDSLLNLRQRTE